MNRFVNLSDDELIALYRGGCNEAFDTLLERYDAYVHTYIRFSLSDEDLIEDIFQDTFIKIMTTVRQGRYISEGKFKQWLTRIAHNLIMDVFRKHRTEAKAQPWGDEAGGDGLLTSVASDEHTAEEQLISADLIAELHEHLELLPAEQREVVRLRYWEEMSFKEIAALTGVSINTALGRMRYALINLRKHVRQ